MFFEGYGLRPAGRGRPGEMFMVTLTNCHPAVTALYYLSVVLVVMFSAHPLVPAAAFLAGGIYLCMREGLREGLKALGLYLVFFLAVALVNPLVSHNGVTPLFFLNGNAVTLEAVLYGMNLGLMLVDVLCWFRLMNREVTSDRFLFLTGRISPKLALLFSAGLRFLPMLSAQAGRIRRAQQGMGASPDDAWTDRLRNTLQAFSALVTWGLEKAVEMGMSMKARGYGLPGRSSYKAYRFRPRDGALLAVVVLLLAAVIAGMASGALRFSFYPSLTVGRMDGMGMLSAAAFSVLAFLPVLLYSAEALQWKYYRSTI